MTTLQQTRPVFDIRDFTDYLQPSKKKGKFICPACGEDNFTISKKLSDRGVPDFTCWNDNSEAHKREIKEALRPWAEVVGNRKETVRKVGYRLDPATGGRVRGAAKPSKKAPKPAPLPFEGVTLARLAEPAIDSPEPQQKPSKQHGQTLVWRFDYSASQWVERIQWADDSKPKGYDKTYRQWHLAEEGEEVPIWANGKQVGTREAAAGEPVCSKGSAVWMPYRWKEAIAAVRSSNATFLIKLEGEPAVETCRQQGFAAITLQGSDWSEETISDLVSRLKAEKLGLVYHPDHDTAGYKKAARLQEACDRAGVPFLAIVPTNLDPDLIPKGDAVDLVASLGGEEFIKRLEAEIQAAVEQRQQGLHDERQPLDERAQQGQTPTEIAAEIVEDYRNRLAWNDEAGLWYRYEAEAPGVWSLESDTAIGGVVLAEFEHRMGLDYKASWIEQCIKILKWKLIVKKWEQPKDLLPFHNGVLHTQTGNFSAHAPGYRFTWALPRDHNPLAANWQAIERWLDEATGGSAKIKHILLCWLNACLKRRSDLQRFLHLTGAGGTGKGTFMRLAIALVGAQNNHASSLSDWCGNRFETVNAYKKCLLTFADEDKYTGGLSNFKKVTGGDAIRGEIKKKQAFDFLFEGMVMLASNYPIFSGDTSSGIYRRLLMVPFNVIIPAHKRRDLEKEFAPELDALTNYVLSIPDEVVSQTLRQSVDQASEVIERTWDWRMRQDSVAAWLNECVIYDPQACERVGNDREDAETLFGSYYHYSEQSGSRPKGSREFSPALLELVNNDPALNWGLEKKRVAGGFLIHGLRLRRAGDENQPYCLEALANVGSDHDVGLDVGLDVGSKPLPVKGYVGCVESTHSLEENEKTDHAVAKSVSAIAVSEVRETSPYISYINESEQAVPPCMTTLQMQDEKLASPYIQPELLSPERLAKALTALRRLDSLAAFKRFCDRFNQLSDDQRVQILEAADLDLQLKFGEFCLQFEAETAVEPVETAPQLQPKRKWVHVQFPQDVGETLVQVLSEKSNSITVAVPGFGTRHVKPSEVVRESEYTGD